VVAGCRLIVTGFAVASAFAAMIAPRRLQSLGAAVQAEAAAVSSVRSTSNVVANARLRLEVAGTARGTATGWLDELEDALRVYFRDAPTKTASVNSDQATFLFIIMLRPD
jgi:nicotinic acid phosphoribosyltransferase